jgi:gamma-glutamylcyclotransferase (GGCT)/AIG2-like uncharacterized protein YtfP
MWKLFVYGSLMNDKVLCTLLDRLPKKSSAILSSYKRFKVKNASFPAIFKSNDNDQVNGFVLEDISYKEKQLLDLFEDEYRIVEVSSFISFNDNEMLNNTNTKNGELIDGKLKNVSEINEHKIFAYVWKENARNELDESMEWDYATFINNHLESFLKNCCLFHDEVNGKK